MLWTFLFTNVGDSKDSKEKGFLHLHYNTQTLVGKLLSNTFFFELHLHKTPMATESNNLTCYKCCLHITYSEITSVFSQFFIYTRDCTKLQTFHVLSQQFRSSHRWCSIKKGVLKNFLKFTGKHLCHSRFFNKKDTLAQVFSCEFCEISKKTFLTKHLWATASVSLMNSS